jgi:hypothetical protein
MYKCPKETKRKIKVHWSNVVQRYLRGVDLRGARSRVSVVTEHRSSEIHQKLACGPSICLEVWWRAYIGNILLPGKGMFRNM